MIEKLRWLLVNNTASLSFVGKDVIAVCTSMHILFYNITSHAESMYTAKDKISGDGIEIFMGHKILYIFTFAEKSSPSRVFLLTYPDFKIMNILQDDTVTYYSTIEFLKTEHIVALSKFPTCKIVVWCWRTGRKLVSHETGIQSPKHFISSNIVNDYFGHIYNNKLCVWEMIPSYKTCLLLEKPLYKDTTEFVDFAWNAEGYLYSIDKDANLYSIVSDGHYMSAVMESLTEDVSGKFIVCYKAGIVVYSDNACIQYIKKTQTEWIVVWRYEFSSPIVKIVSSYMGSFLICVTENGDVLKICCENDVVMCKCIIYRAGNIRHFNIVYPIGNYIVTLNEANILFMWDSMTGNIRSRLSMIDKIFSMSSSNIKPIMALCCANHKKYGVCLVKTEGKMEILSSLCLTDKKIDGVIWRKSALQLMTFGQESGEIFHLKVENGSEINVMRLINVQTGFKKMWISVIDTKEYIFNLIEKYADKATEILLNCYDIATQKEQTLSIGNEVRDVFCFEENNTLISLFKEHYHECKLLRMTIEDSVIRVKETQNIESRKAIYGISDVKNSDKLLTWNNNTVSAINFHPSLNFVERIAPCHRFDERIMDINADLENKYIVTLTDKGSMTVYFDTQKTPQTKKMVSKAVVSQDLHLITSDTLFNEKTETWVENKEYVKRMNETVQWADMRKNISERYHKIQEQLSTLLDENFSSPPSHKLPIKSFILDTEKYEQSLKNASIEQEKEKTLIKERIVLQNTVSEWIKTHCWDPMEVVGTEIHTMFTNKFIENYAMLPMKLENESNYHSMQMLKDLEKVEEQNSYKFWKDIYKETQFLKSNTEKRASKFMIEDKKNKESHSKDISASITHQFITPLPLVCSQILIQTYLQMEWHATRTEKTTFALKSYFNMKFNEMMDLKRFEFNLAKERSERLVTIISELNSLRKLKGNDEEIKYRLEDLQWSQEEIPIKLTEVEPNELNVSPYVSENDIMASKDEMPEIDPFYGKSLDKMMDGMLERHWQDEIKKDISKPKCMIEKLSDDFTDEDLAEVKEWEEKVKIREEERRKYGSSLRKEFFSLSDVFHADVNKFNEKYNEMYLLKLKTESSIIQEELKMMLLRINNLNRVKAVEKLKSLESELLNLEVEQERVSAELTEIQSQLSECHSIHENLVSHDRILDKNFRLNFPDVTPVAVNLCYKFFKKRPKWETKPTMTAGVLNEMAQACLTKEKPPFLHSDCLEYLIGVDQLDAISNMPPVMDDTAWHTMCKQRRVKIDSEIKIRAALAEIADVEAAYTTWQKRSASLKSFNQKLRTDILNHRAFMETQIKNAILQIVIKSGMVEIETTGHMEDFEGAVLIKKEEIEEINNQIRRAAQSKLKAEKAYIGFKKHILTKEWEHATLKLKIKHLESELHCFERMKVTKDIRKYIQENKLKLSEQDVEKRHQQTKTIFERKLFKQIEQADELEMKTGVIRTKIQKLNRTIHYLKANVSKYRKQAEADMQKEQLTMKRMNVIAARNKLMYDIQRQNSIIYSLQTELELQRLKTYPTLSPIQHK